MKREKIVLIIDDEESLRDTVEYKFQANGYRVLKAVDGLDGLEKLKIVEPSLIILDMNMPRMNGLEFYQKIKDGAVKAPYPVLVLTARANMEQLFKDLDVDGFMVKPFELDVLLQEVESILKKSFTLIPKEEGSDALRARHVCIVENNQEIFRDLSTAFLNRGYVVNSAQSGTAAIQRMLMDVPDLALVSKDLSDISGDVVIGKLCKMSQLDQVKYILYTGKTSDPDKRIINQRISEKEGITKFIESQDAANLLDAADTVFG